MRNKKTIGGVCALVALAAFVGCALLSPKEDKKRPGGGKKKHGGKRKRK